MISLQIDFKAEELDFEYGFGSRDSEHWMGLKHMSRYLYYPTDIFSQFQSLKICRSTYSN